MTGRIHSFQSMGAVDGPGIRFVVFLQGCPLRCKYCHNPDTWDAAQGTEYTPEEVAARVRRYRPYFGEEGGVTVSGGEVLLQTEFVTELFRILKSEGISTCLDTSGIGCKDTDKLDALLSLTDLVICDIKFASNEDYRVHTGGSLTQVQSFLNITEQRKVPLWVRHVVLPKHTDNTDYIRSVICLATQYQNLKKIELLPFHKLCIPKYEQLGIAFPCADLPSCSKETVTDLAELIPSIYR